VPTFFAETPNRCITYFATRLQDGRTLVSQPSDPYFAITATAEEPAQLLPPAAMADLLAAHRGFVAQHGVAAEAAAGDATAVDIAGDWMNRRRERLIARGDLVEDAQGVARPRLGFAIRALRAFWSRPKWPPNAEVIPPARLTQIAMSSARIRERAPTASMQMLLFVFSVVLFMAVGGIVFGLQFAWILLVVIAIHEAGHYLAMRAFGYRNVQMLALPLVGGVTVGHEAHPRATHRAWMSLMGPLPGIVIGWALLVVAMMQRDDGWMLHAAWVFLAINYLNVVPVPPLDGGHIVQAMLPARWYGLRIGFLVLACAAGAAAAFGFGMVGLAVIVLLQLGQVAPLLQNRKAIRQLLAQGGVSVGALPARKLRLAFRCAATGGRPDSPGTGTYRAGRGHRAQPRCGADVAGVACAHGRHLCRVARGAAGGARRLRRTGTRRGDRRRDRPCRDARCGLCRTGTAGRRDDRHGAARRTRRCLDR
jgi:Zn-dependent protease